MSEKKPTDDLTPAELRRAIAELLGYHVLPRYFPVSDRTGYALVDRDGAAVGHGYNYWFEEEPWGECPYWPNDPGAALALCEKIARGFTPSMVLSVRWLDDCVMAEFHTGGYFVATGATPALALSHLAHAALTESET